MSDKFGLCRRIIGKVTHQRTFDFRPTHHTREGLCHLVLEASSLFPHNPQVLYAPTAGFTNRVVTADKCDDIWSSSSGEPVLKRTAAQADGVIVYGPMIGVAFFNADCPIVALVEGEKLAVLHGGYRALIREDNREPNIIEAAMQEFDPKKTRAWVGFGIGPCCWVPEKDKREIKNPLLSRHSTLLANSLKITVQECPFGNGFRTVDLPFLIRGMLLEAGLNSDNILVDRRCTCCAKNAAGVPLFWSHTRYKACGEKCDGRNMSVVFLDPLLNSDGFSL